MFEPTETESKETLDNCADAMPSLWELAHTSPERFAAMPEKTSVSRPDEAKAARSPKVKQ